MDDMQDIYRENTEETAMNDALSSAATKGGLPDDIADLLRPLARQAIGMSGADVERLVREARGKARRDGRPVVWQDIATLLEAARPPISDELRWRIAVHEAGHVIARMALLGGTIHVVTIDAPDGGYVKGGEDRLEAQTEDLLTGQIAFCLAGRAAEIMMLGEAAAGSGGTSDSDLAHATAIALSMETETGFSRQQPLLYRKASDAASALIYRSDLATEVAARLDEGDWIARQVVSEYCDAVELMARELVAHGTLEGRQLDETLNAIRALMTTRSPDPRGRAEAENIDGGRRRVDDADFDARMPG